MAIKGSVPKTGVIVPHLVVRDAAEALGFYERAFGAEVLYRSPSPSGVGEHIHVRVWDSLVQISTEEPRQRGERVEGALLASPETLSGSTCVFQIGVEDVDAAYRRAIDCGAAPALPPMDMFWGDRYGWVRDPFGHVWALSQVNEVLTEEEVAGRMREFAARMGGEGR
jgi:PhnB protein